MDLQSGYWQVAMDPQDKEKTAFMSSQGLFQFKVMPFGLASAPATFQRLMEKVLCNLQYNTCLVYLDDVIVYATDFDQAKERLQIVLDRLRAAAYPSETEEFILDTDASNFHLGAVVSQVQAGHERVIAYYTRTLNKAERNYCITRKELLAIRSFSQTLSCLSLW